jgi:ABC-type polysaccharide/polyol phosphate export permease
LIRIYEAGGGPSGLFLSARMAASETYASRYVIWRLFTRDFVGQFRQKILGYLWAIISPLLGIASFVFMNYTGVFNPGQTTVPYPLYVFFGSSLWGVFMGTLGTVSSGLLGNTDLVLRTNIPKVALTLAGFAHVVYSILVSVVVLVIILAFCRVMPSWGALLYLPLLLPLVILGMAIGLLLAVIGVVARDVTGIVMTILGLVMYITPVIYVTDFSNPLLRTIVKYNPLTHLIEFPRSVFFQGTINGIWGYSLASLFSILALVIGVHGFYLIKDKAAERL